MSDPAFVWRPGGNPQRNEFALFRRTFDLTALPPAFSIHLFADTRYRLRCNGEFVGSGPGRFVTSNPEYDTHDLSGLLRPGRNEISVEVNFYGTSSFQTMPDGRPGFIAWGGGDEICLATPGDWRVARMDAWRSDAPVFSFAQGPVEICDTSRLRPGCFETPVVLSPEQCPWGPLAPYSGRPVRRELLEPSRIELAGVLQNPQHIIGYMFTSPNYDRAPRSEARKPFAAAATWICSPRSQSVSASCFWSEIFLNGQRVKPRQADGPPVQGNYQTVQLDLHEGWNLLACEFELLTELWPFLLGFPPEAGLSFHGLPHQNCSQPLAVFEGATQAHPRLPQPSDSRLPEGWKLVDGNPPNLTPARLCAWDKLKRAICRDLPAKTLGEMSPIVARAAVWCLRFPREFLGHVVLEVEAPSGAIMDVACDDWLNAEGRVGLYQSNPFTDSVDRFILQGGRQRIQLFHVRGGKFLQVILRSPDAPAPLSLHRVVVISRQTTGPTEARFQSGQTALDWSFATTAGTLISSTSSAYADCPWRERGMYIGDSLVAMHLDMLLFQDARTARRMLRQFSQARREDGLLPACAPAWLRYSFGDYSLLWIQALHDFWAITGDLELVEELWPTVEGIWSSRAWMQGEGILWNTQQHDLFIDWGVLPEERAGAANAALNILRAGVLRASADLARALGLDRLRSAYLKEACSVEKEIFGRLWIEAEGRLAPSANGKTAGLHTNVLALHYQIGPPEYRARILAYLDPLLRENFRKGITQGQFSGHMELFFFYFLLPALAAHGRAELAELLIEEHYGFLQTLGDDTLPECFCRVQRSVGSRCHSWSGAPAIYAARHVLGLKIAEPGNPRRMLFQPDVHGIRSASGRIAHPLGWIDLQWRRGDGGVFSVKWHAPEGVQISTQNAAVIQETVFG